MRNPDEPASGGAPPGAAPSGDRPGGGDVDSAGLGPRVSAVFTAAEQAAEHILRMAREEAEDLRRQTEAEIEALRSQRRSEAEREARQTVDAARAEGDAVLKEARETARTIEGAARRREQWINEGIRLMVERVEWGRRGLDEVLTRLADVASRPLPEPGEVGEESPPESAEPPRTVAEELRPAAAFAGPEAERAEETAEEEGPRDVDVRR